MPIQITVTVKGDQEVIKLFKAVETQIEPQFLKPYVNDYAEDIKDEMISRMHRDSGDMINSTHTKPIVDGRSVVVGVDYAEDENSRPGRKRGRRGTGQGTPHNFVDPSLRIVTEIMDQELMTRLEHFLRTV